MTHKHTPGTWRIVSGPTFCAIRTDDRVIADMRFVGLHYNKADAALIAAAPEMFAALQWFDEQMRDDSALDMGKLINEMEQRTRAAIAKATQEPTA